MWTETTRVQYRRDELAYASSTRAGEWAQIAALLPPPCRLGRPRRHDLRMIVDAILYLLWTGCQWRALPREFPPRSTVQRYFYCWRDDGTWARISAALVARARQQAGRNPAPSAAIIDSQSVPTTESGGPRGVDAGKRIKGRKRHIVTDSEGFLLAVRVHEANIQDPHGAVPLLRSLRQAFPRLDHVFADRVYRGEQLLAAIADCGPWTIEIVQRPPGVKGFQLLPRRWVVERTFAWLGRSRRLAKDFEASIASATAWVFLANLRLLSRRLANA
ncbi:MAG TPA: IS5 family transposase [Burkholderiales bacterium]|nr:IS5 family transposase [Burkholderiales bacterium]